MAQSYTNAGGSGDRRGYVTIGGDMVFASSGSSIMINGSTADNATWFNTATPTDIRFYFDNERRIVDECKFYQSATTTHGTWEWQGSNDDFVSDINVIGANFTLGGFTTQTMTTLNGNTTAYSAYRLFRISGSTSSGPFTREFEFSIDDGSANTGSSWARAQSSGDRSASITVSGTATFTPLTSVALIDGPASVTTFSAGGTIIFDFAAAIAIDAAILLQDATNSHGDWQWAGSNDNISYTNIGSTFTLGGAIGGDITALNGNTTSYRYYRLTPSSGSVSAVPNLKDFMFRILATPVPDLGDVNPLGSLALGEMDDEATPSPTGTVDLEFSGIELAATGTLVETGTVDLEFSGIELSAAGDQVESGTATLEFFGIELAAVGQKIDAIGTVDLEFSGIELSAAGLKVPPAGTGVRQFWVFGI